MGPWVPKNAAEWGPKAAGTRVPGRRSEEHTSAWTYYLTGNAISAKFSSSGDAAWALMGPYRALIGPFKGEGILGT